MKSHILVMILTFVGINTTRAETFQKACPDIPSCARATGTLLNQKYIFHPQINDKIDATPNLDLTAENAEVLFTKMLATNGYTRVPLAVTGTYEIMKIRDARDSAIPSIRVSKTEVAKFPNHWDMQTLVYTGVHGEVVDDIARTLRSFTAANSRIIPVSISGQILITTSAADFPKLYTMIKDMDKPPTKEFLKRRDERNKKEKAPQAGT